MTTLRMTLRRKRTRLRMTLRRKRTKLGVPVFRDVAPEVVSVGEHLDAQCLVCVLTVTIKFFWINNEIVVLKSIQKTLPFSPVNTEFTA